MKNLKNTINSLLSDTKANYDYQLKLKKQNEENKIKKIKVKNLDEEEYFKKLDDKNKELLELLGNALFYAQNLSKNEAKNFEKIMKI